MNIVTNINDWQAIRAQLPESIGFVHTMGHLHAGHLSLCEQSRRENKVTVAAIFVNPTQFNVQADFALYPRTIETDTALLEKQGVDYLLLLPPEALYHDNYEVQVSESVISESLEGEYRPGHFTGMLTIVLKFLNIVRPTKSYYGEKDYQQLLLIKKMARALFLPVEIVGCVTQRATDELALSSRNSRLTTQQRELAVNFPRILKSKLSIAQMIAELEHLTFKVDYIEERWGRRLGAVWLDDIRLIDNVMITEE